MYLGFSGKRSPKIVQQVAASPPSVTKKEASYGLSSLTPPSCYRLLSHQLGIIPLVIPGFSSPMHISPPNYLQTDLKPSSCPGQCGSVGCNVVSGTKGHKLNSQSEYILRLQA